MAGQRRRKRDSPPPVAAGGDSGRTPKARSAAATDPRNGAAGEARAATPAAAGKPGGSPAGAAAAPRTVARRAPRAIGVALLLLAVLAGAWLWQRPGDRPPALATAPAAAPPATTAPAAAARATMPAPAAPAAAYVDNRTCVSCHAAEARHWQGSHHALAMARPTPETVRGDFDGAQFRHHGVTTRFFRRDGKYFVHTDGVDGRMADFEVQYTFGWDPLQQYLIETEGGRLQPLTIAWDARAKRWFHLLPDEKTPPGDVLHWTGRYQTGNTMCIACHTTGFDKRYDAATDRFDSRWAEGNVSCQACHGPGSRHAEWAHAQAEGRAAAPPPRHGLVADLRDARTQVDVCSACHSRRAELSAQPVPGEPRLDHYLPSLLLPGLYHADGQQLDEVYVDGSFRQSKMFAAGVKCSDCHEPHRARPRLDGNALCGQCHARPGRRDFPAAAGDYDSPAHHHHREGSAGAQCVACHMPAKTYMRIQPRPDHSLRIPRPDLSVAIGTPNACNQCHAKQTAQWAADAVERWYGPKRRPHFGTAFAAARNGEPGADAALAAIAADRSQPGIVRATAIHMLGGRGTAAIDAARDPDAEVRAAAAASLGTLPAAQRVPTLAPLLQDPLRAVRIAAARSLASLPAEQFDAPTRAAFDAALAEYVAAQQVSLDMPGANLNLGALYADLGRDELAERYTLAALKIDPDFTPARANLARFYAARSRPADAERVLREGLEREPGIGELQYALGLLLAEQQRLPEAADALAQAAKLMPRDARAHYNLGLARQQLGQLRAAEAALRRARELAPTDPAIAYALAVFYAQQGRRGEALREAEALQQLRPGDAQVAQLIRQLQAQR